MRGPTLSSPPAVLAALVAAAPLATAQDRQRWPSRGGTAAEGRPAKRAQRRARAAASGQRGGGRSARSGGRASAAGAPRESARPRASSARRRQRPPRGRQPPPQVRRRQRREPRTPTQRQRAPAAGRRCARDGRQRTGATTRSGRYAVPRTGPAPRLPRRRPPRLRAAAAELLRLPLPVRTATGIRSRRYLLPLLRYPTRTTGTGLRLWTHWSYHDVAAGTRRVLRRRELRTTTSASCGSTCEPRDAEVYIDGYYAGVVDDFDGRLQGLRLESGNYRVQVALPGFEPLDFDVHVQPGRTTTYRGELIPARP